MKKTTKQVREALRGKQPFAFTCRRLPMCVSPRICGAGICVEDRMFLACTTSLIRKVDVNPYQLPARYAAAVASLLNELWDTSAITGADEAVLKTAERLLNFIYNDIVDPRDTTVSLQSGALVKTVLGPVSPFLLDTDRGTGSLHLVIIGIDGVRINMQGYRMLHFGGQKSIE